MVPELPFARLPRFSPLLDPKRLDGLLTTKPRWLERPFNPPDGTESGASNDKRGLVDLLAFGVDNHLHPDDGKALIRRGWSCDPQEWLIRGEPTDVMLFKHPHNGAQVLTYEGFKRHAGLTAVRFCPGHVIFGRNDRIADVRQDRLTELIYAFTEHLMPATTQRAWRGPAWRCYHDDEAGKRARDRRFLLWTLRRIDLCLQARVSAVSAAFRVARLARWSRTKSAPLLWIGDRIQHAAFKGEETGLTFGVPPSRANEQNPDQDQDRHTSETWAGVIDDDGVEAAKAAKATDEQRVRQGRQSLTLYDKGRHQRSASGWQTFTGEPCPVDRVLRCEFSYRGLDACAALAKELLPVGQSDDPDSPVIIRVPKTKVSVETMQHSGWLDLSYTALHRAVQRELLGIQASRLRITASKGREHRRGYPDGWFDALPDAERRVIWKLAQGKMNPTNDAITDVQRRQAMELAMARTDLPNGPFNLFWRLWPRPGQHLSPDTYQAAWPRERKWKPGEAAKELELVKGQQA
jgi:hypothetical protein